MKFQTIRNARRNICSPRPYKLKLSRWLPILLVDKTGKLLGKSFREGYLHPTKGLRVGSLPILSRWPTAA